MSNKGAVVEPIPEPEPKRRIKTLHSRKWILVGVGVLVFAFGVWVAGLWGGNRENMLLAIMTIAAWAGGGLLVYQGAKRQDTGITIGPSQGKIKDANTVNICVRQHKETKKFKPFKIEFVKVADPTGTLLQLTNDNRYYYFNMVKHMADGEIETTPWELPDGEYLSPRKYVIPLTMKANERYVKYQRSASLFKKVSLGVMLAAFGITTLVFFITVTGG